MNKRFIKFIMISALPVLMLAFALSTKAVNSSSADGTNKFQQAKEKYLNEFNASRSTKRAFEEAQTKFRNLKANSTSTQAQNVLREQFQQRAKEFLKKEISAMIKYLEAMKNKVTNMNKMDEGDRAFILTKINENIAWLRGKQAEIDGAASDKLKTISQEIKDYWKNIRVTSRRVTGQILASRIKFLIGKAELMAQKLETKIQELKQAGKNTAKLEELLADFKEKIVLAKEKYEQAKAKFAAISSKDNVVQFYQEGHKLIKDANQYLKQAKNDLTQIVRRIKQLEKSNSDNATSTPKIPSGNEPG